MKPRTKSARPVAGTAPSPAPTTAPAPSLTWVATDRGHEGRAGQQTLCVCTLRKPHMTWLLVYGREEWVAPTLTALQAIANMFYRRDLRAVKTQTNSGWRGWLHRLIS